MTHLASAHRDLLARLEAFDIDGDAPALTFAGRLARENGWTTAFAERVVGEYKRFVFLAATAGHPVTPSEQVDQAWHLHLAYTDSYWNRLCGGVLGRALHHNPTRGGEAENEKFDGWYERTLATYERTFGHAPPPDVWPPASQRFGGDLDWVRVNRRRCLIVPKCAAAIGAAGLVLGGVLLGGLPTLSAVTQSAQRASGWSAYVIFGLAGLVLLLLVVATFGRRGSGRGGCGGGLGGGCSVGSDGGCGGGGCGSGGGGGGCGGGCGS